MEGQKVIHYGAAATEGVAPVNAERKKKMRRPKEHEPVGRVAFCVGSNFDPNIVTVYPGEDVSHKLMSISKREARSVSVLSGSGAVSAVTLRHSNSSGQTTYEGSFMILSLSGLFIPKDNGGTKSIVGSMSVSLAGPDGRVMGGGLAGPLIAAAPVQVVITSFLPSYQEPKLFAPTSSPVPATGEGQTRGASESEPGPSNHGISC